ncbi:histone protein [Streptomyces sp. NPDC047022]|uniref:histone protein n=1 Tax=Streptomyces sp. NPDC047022 TaxID=3155737 RepID=UPI0033DD08BE
MNDSTKIALAAAVAGGYVLGRAKKGRLAFAVGSYLAGRRFGLAPQQLLTEGLKRLQELPQFADLNEQMRGEFKDAGRQALAAAADRKFGDLADALHERTARIGSEKDEEEDEEEEEEYEPEEEEPEEEAEGEEEEEEESPRSRRAAKRQASRASARKSPAKKAQPAKRTAGKRTTPAKKTTARKPAAEKTAPRKTASKKTTAKKSSTRRR